MNRIFKYIFATLASAALLSVVVFAQEEPEIKIDSKSDPIHLTKTAEQNADGSYTLRLESFVTGYKSNITTSTTSTLPLDIALVLDVSGSMGDSMTSYTYNARNSQSYSYNGYGSNTYYYLNEDGEYCAVYRGTAGNSNNRKYYLYFSYGGKTYYLRGTGVVESRPDDISNNTDPIWTGVLYTRTTTTQTRLAALKTACNNFIDIISNNSNPKTPHQISIITFQSSGKSSTLANSSSSFSSLKNTINGLTAGGGTYPAEAMTKAYNILNGLTRQSAKLVVMFTDGVPAGQTGDDPDDSFSTTNKSQANATIKASNSIKALMKSYNPETKVNGSIEVYTVGVFGVTPSADVNNYMSYTSSNYPSATSLTSSGTKASDKYYMTASSAGELSNIFKTIANSSTDKSNAGSGNTEATNENQVTVRDIVTPKFVIPTAADGIKVYIAPSTGVTKADSFTTANYAYDADGYTWGEPVEAEDVTISSSVASDGASTVDVSGFDFSANWVGYDEVINNGVTESSVISSTGHMLIVEILIMPDPNDVGGSVSTNVSTSGLYITKNGTESSLEQYPLPDEVLIPMDLEIVMNGATKEYTVTKDGKTSTWTGKLYTEGETAIFQVTNYDNTKTWTVAVTAGADGTGRASIKVPFKNDPEMDKYTVTELPAWSYRFNTEVDTTVETSVAAGTKSLTKQLTKDDHTFTFVAVDTEDRGDDDIVSRDLERYFYDESNENNEFYSSANPSGTTTTSRVK